MKYFIMNEINHNNEFHRTRIEKMNNIECVDYGHESNEIIIFVNNMTYKKLPKTTDNQVLCFTFISEVITQVKENEVIDIDSIWNENYRRFGK